MNYQDAIYRNYLSLGFCQMNSADYDRSANAYTLNYDDLIGRDRNIKIVDIGCGMGHFLYYLKKKGYENFSGVDIGKEQIAYCRTNITQRVEWVSDIYEFLNIKKDYYDVIALNDVVEHFKKDEVFRLLGLILASLKPGGRLILKTPNMGNILGTSSFYIDFTHEVGFSEISILQILKAAGFKKAECRAERLYISSSVKRLFFMTLRGLYLKAFNLLLMLERPGDNYPMILSKNIIAWADK